MHRTSLFKEGNVINNDCSNTVKIRKCSYDELTTSSKCNMHRQTRQTQRKRGRVGVEGPAQGNTGKKGEHFELKCFSLIFQKRRQSQRPFCPE